MNLFIGFHNLLYQVLPFKVDNSRIIKNFLPLQFYDLEELFRTGGQVPETSYIFMVIKRSKPVFSLFILGCNFFKRG